MANDPAAQRQRSFVYRELEKSGARFGEFNGQVHALEMPNVGDADSIAESVCLCDLSPLPRVGFKGRETFRWLKEQGIVCNETPNRADRQSDGGLCAVLSPGEVVLLSPLSGNSDVVHRLENDWSMDLGVSCYHVPRSSLSFEFLILGGKAPEMFAKICGVDLSADKFVLGDIAQTSMARMNCTAIREDIRGNPAYRLLGDSASAEYLWGCLFDAMSEFHGRPIGLVQVHDFVGSSS